jgi:DNA-binding transcriptional ArsR family regulator
VVSGSHEQREALKDPTRMAIYSFLQGRSVPTTVGTIVRECRGPADREYRYAAVFYHVAELVEAGLVEKVGDHPATYKVLAEGERQ